ncbi:4'-phosphopantetheinyl transferase [Microbacterium sp. NPDC012755]|uniref:4'-phosphopantetheinyl transferase family protein n=1 Tax=Microbacterium sp. NPDC012755 TaxID=3364184 RepID=UPI0036AC0A39
MPHDESDPLGREAPMTRAMAVILPDGVACAESGDETVLARFAEEELLVADAVPGRRSEFFSGRECARRALGEFGVPDAPIGRVGRRPVWPEGFVGSITHCEGYRAAAVARKTDILTLGIDAEPDALLPEDVLDLVSSPHEQDALRRLPSAPSDVHWDRLLFSAKESVYKAWSPITDEWLGFEEVSVEIDPSSGVFLARLLREPWRLQGRSVSEIDGRWTRSNGLLLTAVVIPR